MQSGGRNPAGRASSPVASPSSGFDPDPNPNPNPIQQLGSRQSLQQQLLRKPGGNEALLAYQAGGLQGVMGGSNFASTPGSMQLPQQPRKFFDLAQQHGSPQEGQNRNQGVEQQVLNPVHQAYLQFAMQQKSALAMQTQQHAKMGGLGPTAGKDQDIRVGNLKTQELISMQVASQAQASSSKSPSEHLVRGEKPVEQGQQPPSDQRNEPKHLTQQATIGQMMPTNVTRPMQMLQSQQTIQNMANNQIAVAAQLQAMQAWALERNIDLSSPAHAGLTAQFIRMAAMQQQKNSESNTVPVPQSSSVPLSTLQVTSPPGPSESSPRGNSFSDGSGQPGSAKARQAIQSSAFGSTAGQLNNTSNISMQQLAVNGRDNQLPSRLSSTAGNGMHPPQSLSAQVSQGPDDSLLAKNSSSGAESSQMQYLRQPNRLSPLASCPSNDAGSANHFSSQGGEVVQMHQQRFGFTKLQLHVLKAQILAFRRLKKGEGSLPQELLRAIAPPPLECQQPLPVVFPPTGPNNQDKSAGKNTEDQTRQMDSSEKGSPSVTLMNGPNFLREESVKGDEKATVSMLHVQGTQSLNVMKEPKPDVSAGKEEQQATATAIKSDQEVEPGNQKNTGRSDFTADRGKTVQPQVGGHDVMQVKKAVQISTLPQSKDAGSARKYHGPLFDFPFFTRKHDSIGSAMMVNSNNNLTLTYDVKDILFEEGTEVTSMKRDESIKKIGDLLTVNLERKRIRPDLVMRLQIEEKKLRLLDLQSRLRQEVDKHQQEIMVIPERPYRRFVKLCERQRFELNRQVVASQKAIKEKQLKSISQWRKKLLEAHWAIRDARTARNRGVAKYHERMLKEFSKRKDDDRNRRMEALKNNDVERYREMLLEQQTSMPGDAAERYAVLSSFLSQTEEYLHKLGSKITAAKNQQEVEEAANAAAAAARSQGLSQEEVRAAASCAGEEVMIRNQFMEMNAPKDSSSVNKYYHLAHAVSERVLRQPSMLRLGTLRDYQLVGLQWMLSLYNNKLNGILADEMGLGKTVQVMALIAYLMEFKGNYGPHLIIVPNAVMVNWKSELHNWLPSVSCIFYVGGKDQRSKLFSQEVLAMKFNVLVTTYEFIMYDRSKLSKLDWKYIVIDEAQRMKDRDSVLARDLDRYRCQRRLLLTGTPLQNDLKELWSLLNLLLPEVFDNRKAFHDWFSKPFQKEAPTHDAEDDWLETEKKVIIIHRLHQILEPFMLRRRVEDVEGSLPPKVSIVLRCRMSAIQSAIYDWIKATGTLRVDPEDEKRKAQKNPNYQAKIYKTLNNRCMELRKACNHPLLNYPYFNDFSKDFLVKSCGKLWILDRILIKLQRTGHRVLLFSTMTKLLDIVEEYLQWRRLVYRRIDGTTSLEDRESAILDFNSTDSDCFIFLLSIRAAGRGLNLQSADTVIIYDPDPNPKNEEQAVARAHRIGQKREVKVIYMEAVVDKIASHQKEDEFRTGGSVDMEDDLAGKDRYIGSIESLIRNNIQQYKIDMADEVINAGRFDQRTTHEERRLTLETLLHDDERYQETLHDVPSLLEVNRMIARSEEEVELFDQMDEELDWAEEMTSYEQVPKWLRASTTEVNSCVASLSKKPLKNALLASNAGVEPSESEMKRGRSKGKKYPNYKEIDDENEEFTEASSDEANAYSVHEEEGEIGEFEDDEVSGAVEAPLTNKERSEYVPVCDGRYVYPLATESTKNNHLLKGGSSGSSSESRRLNKMVSPSLSSQKFGSLSALDARPSSLSKRLSDELEEGEITFSGDSHMDHQRSGSWIHDHYEGEDEQVLQPKIKRKRSIRIRPQQTAEKPEERSINEMSSQLPFQIENKYQAHFRSDPETRTSVEAYSLKHDQSEPSLKDRRNVSSRRTVSATKSHSSPKSISRSNCISSPPDDACEHSRENWDSKAMSTGGTSTCGTKMSDIIQRRCKNVISKLQRRVDKEGHQIVPLLTDLWKRIESSSHTSGTGNNLLDLRKIDQRVDRSEYNGVMELVFDVQFMLKSAMNFYGFSHEVRSEARKVHDLFFDILKIAFPDTDFRESRSALSFTSPVCTSSGASPRTTGVRRQKIMNEVEAEAQKSMQRGRGQKKNPQRLGGEQYEQESSAVHPGELVVCKKKRKDREKSTARTSPPSREEGSRLRSPPGTAQQQGWARQGGVGWANPVKRLRTDAGKRRPSHL